MSAVLTVLVTAVLSCAAALIVARLVVKRESRKLR